MDSLSEFAVLFIIILFFFCPIPSIAKETDLTPLTIFLSNDPDALGTGALTEEDIFHPDPYRPTTMLGQNRRLSLDYHAENVLHIKEGDQQETSITSTSKTFSALLPLELPIFKKSVVTLSAGNFQFSANDTNHNLFFKSYQGDENKIISFSSAPFSFIKGGIGWELYTDHSNRFYEAAFTPADGLSINYRVFNREMHIENALSKDNYFATFLFNPSEDVRETSINADIPRIFQCRIALEGSRDGNGVFYLKAFTGPSMTVNYQKQKRAFDFLNEIIINGSANGHISGSINSASDAIEVDHHSSSRRYLLGIKKSTFEMGGAGLVSGGSILNFWENLLAGERFFNYNLSMRNTQYHAGFERRSSESLTFRGGVQYMITKPTGNVDHWTPFPIIKIGRLDEEMINLEYTKATLGALNLGLTYRMKKLEVTYGVGQIIPIATEKRGTATADTGPAGEDDKRKKGSGGTLHSMKATWHF